MSYKLYKIHNKKLLLSEEEYNFVKESIIDQIGEESASKLFWSNDNGFITAVLPLGNDQQSLLISFSLLNIMVNQRLLSFDYVLNDFAVKINSLEKKLNKKEE